MTSAAKKILDEALALPREEREAIMDALSESLDESLSPEWRAEIAARLERLERGETTTVAWSEVRDRLRKGLGR